jgi:hypothetical protein
MCTLPPRWKRSLNSDAQPFEFRQSDADVNGSVTSACHVAGHPEYVSARITWLFWVTSTSSSLTFRLVNPLDTPLTNLAFTVPAGERYSYIFNGNSQALITFSLSRI